MLDTKKLFTKILEAFGVRTSGNWKYIILGNVFIGAVSYQGTLTIQTAVGQIYQTASSSSITYPETLDSVQYANVTIVDSSYSVWTAIYSSSTSGLSYRALSALSRAAKQYRIKAFVFGTVGGQ